MKIIGIILIIISIGLVLFKHHQSHKSFNIRSANSAEETKRSSEIVASNERKIPFILNDHTDEIIVNPDGATIDTVKILDEFRQNENRGKPSDKKRDFIISLKTERDLIHRIKQTETILLFSAIASATIAIILIVFSLR